MSYNNKGQLLIRLVPQEPVTNSRLMIYCSTPDKIPISFCATWSRFNQQTGYREQIKNHQGSSYECSPLDFNYSIQATIYYEEKPGFKSSKKALFPAVKLNRQLQERQLYVMQPINCRMRIDQLFIDCKIIPKYQCLNINSNGYKLEIPLGDFSIQVRQNCLSFILVIQNRYQDLLSFASQSSGISMSYCSRICQFIFNNRVDRDVILLSIAQDNRRNSTSSMKSNSSQRTPRKDIILNTSVNRDRSDKSLSMNKKKDPNGKIKISQRVQKKANYSGFSKPQESLNIYQQEKNTHEKKNFTSSNSKVDLDAMDLRQSFAEFEQNSFIKQERSSNNSYRIQNSSKKLQEENKLLKQQNKKLKQEMESVALLAKQNVVLKKKYHQLSEEINRLQFERKQILQDKLKFQASFHKQRQQKQYLKKQVQSLKEQLGLQNIERKDNSPILMKKQPLNRPVTPDRLQGTGTFGNYTLRGPN